MTEFPPVVERSLEGIIDQGLIDIGARELLEAVRETWGGVGRIEPTNRHGLRLVYTYKAPFVLPPYLIPHESERRYGEERFLRKYVLLDAATGFEVNAYRHLPFMSAPATYCFRAGKIDNLNYNALLDTPEELGVCKYDERSKAEWIEEHREEHEREGTLAEGEYNSSFCMGYPPNCIFIGDEAKMRLGEVLVGLLDQTRRDNRLPEQEELRAKADIYQLTADSSRKIYPDSESYIRGMVGMRRVDKDELRDTFTSKRGLNGDWVRYFYEHYSPYTHFPYSFPFDFPFS